MLREITSHRLNGLNESLRVLAMDPPGHGGANHHYAIRVGDSGRLDGEHEIFFQKGPIQEAGVNGVSNEALLAIVIDRLESFQQGDFGCRENVIALEKLEEALMWLQKRTRDRIARGVEGTYQR